MIAKRMIKPCFVCRTCCPWALGGMQSPLYLTLARNWLLSGCPGPQGLLCTDAWQTSHVYAAVGNEDSCLCFRCWASCIGHWAVSRPVCVPGPYGPFLSPQSDLPHLIYIHCNRWRQVTCASGIGRAALDLGLSAGLSVSGLYGPLKGYRERELAKIFASGQTLRLQFPKEDLGFVYDKPGAAICPDDLNPSGSHGRTPPAAVAPDSADLGGRTGRVPQAAAESDGTAARDSHRGQDEATRTVGASDRHYQPSCAPGGRLPHCLLYPMHTGEIADSGFAARRLCWG